MLTVARRRAIDLGRRRATRDRALPALARDATAHPPDDEVADAAYARWLAGEARRLLPPVTYDVLTLAATGMSNPAIAARLGLTVRAVENHLYRARRVLRALG